MPGYFRQEWTQPGILMDLLTTCIYGWGLRLGICVLRLDECQPASWGTFRTRFPYRTNDLEPGKGKKFTTLSNEPGWYILCFIGAPRCPKNPTQERIRDVGCLMILAWVSLTFVLFHWAYRSTWTILCF